jgi:DNA-directed RNA polymerase subunit omega
MSIMARITTSDCERFVPNRFELVLLAAERAHQLETGAEPLIARGDEPAIIIALREIASGRIGIDHLRDCLIGRHSRAGQDIMRFSEPSLDWLEPSSLPAASSMSPAGGKAPARTH